MAQSFTKSRIEAFSDGVIAVIITIMVLELKVPAANGLAGLRAVAPLLGVYALSFAFVGIYWINHHLLLMRVEQSTPRILRSNLIWLFFLSLLPFFTAYVIEKREDSFSVAIYSASLLTTALTFMLLRLGINARQHREGSLDRADVAMQRKHWISLVSYLCAIPLAIFAPVLTLCFLAIVNLLWVVPSLGVEHRRKHPAGTPQPR